jgi:Ca-activated chloride channel family protein
MNKALIAKGQQPMTIFYVAGATAIANMPVRYVDNGDANKLDQYQKLVAFLTRPEIQKKVQALGWRTNPIGMQCDDCDPAVFNPDWGINTTTEFQEMVFPKSPVTKAALDQYQALFRKPSFTVYCLDYSPSMTDNGGTGRKQMVDAMDLLLDQERAAGVSLQATTDDVTVVFGFSAEVRQVSDPVLGNDPAALKNLSNQISGFDMGGGTAMFDCVQNALAYIAGHRDPKYNYSIIALTDGGSNAGATQSDFDRYYEQQNLNIPVYGIAFGDADFSQLDQFKMTGGDVYDGRQDVATAFRMARGNN